MYQSLLSRKIICVCLFIFLPALNFANHTGFQLPDGKNEITIPFKLINDLIIIKVRLNKKKNAYFILDTGTRTPLLFNRGISDQLQLRTLRNVKFSGAGKGTRVKAKVAANLHMQIGELCGDNIPLVVVQKPHKRLQIAPDFFADGIIGYQIFARFIVNINFKNKNITLIKPEYFTPDSTFQCIPMNVEDTKPYITSFVNVNGFFKRRAKLLVDTGANHSLLLENNKNDPFYIPEKAKATNLGRGLGGIIKGLTTEIPSLQISHFVLEKVATSFPFQNHYSEQGGIDGRHGTIGTKLLNSFDLTFDYIKEKLYLKSTAHFTTKQEISSQTTPLP